MKVSKALSTLVAVSAMAAAAAGAERTCPTGAKGFADKGEEVKKTLGGLEGRYNILRDSIGGPLSRVGRLLLADLSTIHEARQDLEKLDVELHEFRTTSMALSDCHKELPEAEKSQVTVDALGATLARLDPLLAGIAKLQQDLKGITADTGMDDFFRAELVTGVLLSRADVNPTNQQQKNEDLHVRWESRYFGLKDKRLAGQAWHWKLNGRFGLVPVAALATPTSTTTTTTTTTANTTVTTTTTIPPLRATDARAFVWDARLQGHFSRGQVDFVVYASGGQTWLLQDKVLREGANGQEEIALVGAPAADSVAAVFEAGGELQIFKNPPSYRLLGIAPEPTFKLSVAFRSDKRLRGQTGTTTDAEQQRRLVIRLLLAELHVFDRRDQGQDKTKEGPFSIRFGIEHERGWSGLKAPPVTRLLIAGDLHLLQAFGK